MTKILKASEKYGNRYFAFSTPNELARICLKLMSERLKQGYYSKPEALERERDDEIAALMVKKINPTAAALLELAPAEIEGLPVALRIARDEALKAREDITRNVTLRYDMAIAAARELETMLTADVESLHGEHFYRGNKPYRFLSDRSDYEYEEIDIFETEDY